MKQTNKLLKQLATYSSVAAAVVGVNDYAKAELVGYDVNPDSILINPIDTASFYTFNINNLNIIVVVNFSF